MSEVRSMGNIANHPISLCDHQEVVGKDGSFHSAIPHTDNPGPHDEGEHHHRERASLRYAASSSGWRPYPPATALYTLSCSI